MLKKDRKMMFKAIRLLFVAVMAATVSGHLPWARAQGAEAEVKKIALIATCYYPNSHADAIATKFFAGFPSDDGLVPPRVRIVSMYIDQPQEDDLGHKVAEKFNVPIHSTIDEALTLGGKELAVDGVLYIGEHGRYARSRLGAHMYPHLDHLEQVFRVFDASNRVVPVFCDKHLAYSWLDSKWIYDRARELGVPMMAGSSPWSWPRPPARRARGKDQAPCRTTSVSPSPC